MSISRSEPPGNRTPNLLIKSQIVAHQTCSSTLAGDLLVDGVSGIVGSDTLCHARTRVTSRTDPTTDPKFWDVRWGASPFFAWRFLYITPFANLFLFFLLFSFQLSFFLFTMLSFFLRFSFAFIFTSFIAHVCSSVFLSN